MKALLLAVTLLGSNAFAAGYYTTGDKIFFQSASTWVSGLGKNICLDGDTFRAVVTKCVAWGGKEESYCQKQVKVEIAQAVNSTKTVCVDEGGREDSFCRKTEVVPYIQSPNLTVKYLNDRNDSLIKTVNVRVKDCQ